jgi:carbon storage regulator
MLILSRKPGESIVIGQAITVTVKKMKGNVVQLGIEAPKEVPIVRSELQERIRDN